MGMYSRDRILVDTSVVIRKTDVDDCVDDCVYYIVLLMQSAGVCVSWEKEVRGRVDCRTCKFPRSKHFCVMRRHVPSMWSTRASPA